MKKTLELLVGILLIFCFGCNVDPGDGPVGPGPGEDPVYQYYVSPLGDDANSGSREKPWLTIAHGITNLRSGDTLNIRSGTYREELYFNHTGTESRIITIKGESFLNTFIEGASADRDVLFIENSRYVDISQLTIRNAPRTGIRLSYSHDVAIHNCLIADSGKWGVFTDFSDNTALTYCEIYGSREEHGVYISNSSDNAVIGNNIVHHNYASGIQVNADPSMGGDGISSDCLIENNIVFENGIGGGAAINLASVRDCILRNNIIYNNYAGGIAAWDDDQGTQWGCTDLDIFHNSLYFRPGEGRWAISLKNGCTGAEVFNNAVCSGAAGCFQFTDDSASGLTIDYNIYNRSGAVQVIDHEGDREYTLAEWQFQGQDRHSNSFLPQLIFAAPGSDFHLGNGSNGINRGLNVGVAYDFEGDARPQGTAPDIGADEYK